MDTPAIEIAIGCLAAHRPGGAQVVEDARTELDILKLDADYRKITWEKVLELARVINHEFPATDLDQAADEWGKHVVDIAINRLRNADKVRMLVQNPSMVDELLKKLSAEAQKSSFYDYGLPLFDDALPGLREIVVRWIAEM